MDFSEHNDKKLMKSLMKFSIYSKPFNKSVPVNVATIFIEELNINGPDIFIYLEKW